ncbi:MAG: glycoside hydrolase family 2 [Clostridia bacterium]|nr:glycoside hydrolase family 2 [Clostridia bacterium]
MRKLYTPRGENLPEIPHNVSPRPRMRRDSFFCLNGRWDFAATRSTKPPVFDRTILVPFAPESLLSGIGETYDDKTVLWYRRAFTLPENFKQGRVLLHFGAVDQCCSVLLNGTPLGDHEGGYIPFTFDITDYLKEENELAVRVTDRLDSKILPYGKQKRKRGGMWYTPTSGIWQTVWLESVPETYITDLAVEVTADWADLYVEGAKEGTVDITTPFGPMQLPLHKGRAHIAPPFPRPWTPEDPYLYEFTVTTDTDKVHSYFALREFSARAENGLPRMCLNKEPYFFHGLLDQGYWSDGGMTPADPECFKEDILAMKSLGFNTLRKHIKVEPQLFYYYCDKLGMLVMQDMVNNSDYSFLRDTALPTIGRLRKKDERLHRNPKSRAAFFKGMDETVKLLKNHPCICLWTIFNEGWGQFASTEAYYRLRKMDRSRFIDTASGWFIPEVSDVCSRHIYFKKLTAERSRKPYFLSEFGGFVYKDKAHSFSNGRAYGYGKCATREEFVTRLNALYRDEVLPLVKQGLCAAVYTQVSDVEDECNGLVTFDRRVQKITPEEFAPLSRKICNAVITEDE